MDLQGPLRAEQPLEGDAPQGGGVEAVAKFLRPDIAYKVRGAVGVAVHMAVETGDTEAGLFRAPVIGGIELLLGKGRDQQPQALELLGVQDAVENCKIIVRCHHFAL